LVESALRCKREKKKENKLKLISSVDSCFIAKFVLQKSNRKEGCKQNYYLKYGRGEEIIIRWGGGEDVW